MNGPVITPKRKLNQTWNKHLKKFGKRKAKKKLRRMNPDRL